MSKAFSQSMRARPFLRPAHGLVFSAALFLSASHPAIIAGASLAQPDEELEEFIEEELEEEFEDEIEDDFEDEIEEDFDEDDFEDEDFADEDSEEGEVEDEDLDEEEFEDDDLEEGGFDEEEPEEDLDDEDEIEEDYDDDEPEDDEPEDDEEDPDLEEDEPEDDGEDDGEDDDGEDEDAEEDEDVEDAEFEEEEDEEEEDELEEIEEERDLEASFGLTTELVFVGRDPQEFDVAGGEWLVVSDPDEIAEIEERGFEVRATEAVELLDSVMIRVSPPEGSDLLESRDLLLEVVTEDQIDYNHLYQPQARFRRKVVGVQPLSAMPLSNQQRSSSAKIGLIDTSVQRGTKAIANANIIARDFVRSQNRRPSEHGTAIATIIVGDDAAYRGLVPSAQLYAASVFEILPGRGPTASTASLVRALNWMVENKVPVVNMSLTGPENAILQRAIDRARAKNVLVVAAIGNEGPTAKPLYPAAYGNVVSVTAIDAQNRVFRKANRGRYLDFSAPGVGILHYSANGQQIVSTGTSIAAPFAAVAITLSKEGSDAVSQRTLAELASSAVDLGAPGRDNIYGYGLIRPQTPVKR